MNGLLKKIQKKIQKRYKLYPETIQRKSLTGALPGVVEGKVFFDDSGAQHISRKGYKLYLETIQTPYKLYHGSIKIHKHGFWFVDIPRTSSTSIKAELGRIYGLPYGKAKLFIDQNYANELSSDYFTTKQHKKHYVNQIFKDHLLAIEMQKIVGEKIWEKIFTFTFVRNPWDRILSLYFYIKQKGDILDDMQFRDYIFALSNFRKKGKESLFRNREHYLSASDYIIDANVEILVDFIGKYENRDDDIKIIAQKLGCEQLGTLAINKSIRNNRHYSEYYDKDTQEIVREIYRKDIELFEYKFEA